MAITSTREREGHASIGPAAKVAFDDGRAVFCCAVNYDVEVSGELPVFAGIVEDVESVGWRLDSWAAIPTTVPGTSFTSRATLLFRR